MMMWTELWLTVALPVLLSVLFLSRLAAGVGLYWGTTTAVGVVQGLLLRRRVSR